MLFYGYLIMAFYINVGLSGTVKPETLASGNFDEFDDSSEFAKL